MRDRLIELLKGAENKVSEMLSRPLALEEWLGVYADHLLAAGVVVPPCKVGDDLYGIRTSAKTGKTYVEELEVAEVMYFSLRGVRPFIIACFGGKKYDNADFGKTVFFTREEAERTLAERREGNGFPDGV